MKYILAVFLFSSFYISGCNSAEIAPQATPSPSDSPAALILNAPVRDGNSCQTAKDCRGMLPKMCRKCTNGNTGSCAHWSCVENVCKIKTCDIIPTTKE